MKKLFSPKNTVFALLLAGSVLAGYNAQARERSPIWEMRRTVVMPFGQHRITLEAPLGMCFLDESQYLEGAMIKHLRKMNKSGDGGMLMAVFADCLELEKFTQGPKLAADMLPGMPMPDTSINNQGTISWLAPKLGRAPLGLPEYLDMREPTFRDDMKKSVSNKFKVMGNSDSEKISDNYAAKLLMGAPDQYIFDDKANRTDTGVSIGYSTEFESEYQKHRQNGAVGTTMLRQFPVQVTLSSSGDKPRDLEKVHATLDKFLMQIAGYNP
ncbi:MAG TPA: hypothetical protein VEF76_10710 [Patescibacteria group bacterium]|nr:hypothetical protein [Patescibacteria group bacterium]